MRPSSIRNSAQVNDPNFDRKLDLITAGAKPFIKKHLLTKITRENCLIIINYVLAFQTEVNPSEKYRLEVIHKLKLLAEFHNPKSFREMTRQDILEYLDSLRKPESVDPLHKWKGTHEVSRIFLLRFFKWLYAPDKEPKNRPKPDTMQQIPKIKRLEESIYKPTDMWTEEDDALFYKYCPSMRDRCYLAVANDTGCRVDELLKLKIKDVVIEKLDSGHHSARIRVNGKTGTRDVTITNSYPFLKEWLSHSHPYGNNSTMPLFCGISRKNTGRRLSSSRIIHSIFVYHYQKKFFPKLLEDPLVPEEDKRRLRELLQKPWNPHARRHKIATEVSKEFKDRVLINQYMGWSPKGNTAIKYQHYFSDDAHIAKLEADGFLPKGSGSKAKNKGLLRPKPCPNCMEPNKPDSKWCANCKFVLSFEAYNEKMQDTENIKKKVSEMEAKQTKLEHALKKMILDNSDLQVGGEGTTEEEKIDSLTLIYE